MGELLTAQAGRVIGVALNGPGPASSPALVAQPQADTSEEEVTLKSIIADKPKTKIVRAFMRANLEDIQGEDETMFA